MAEESTQLAVQSTEVAVHFGDRHKIAAIRQRMISMAQLPADVPDHVVWQAAQLCEMYELNPFTGDLYIMETGSEKVEGSDKWIKKYSVHVGVKGLRKTARRKANFQTAFRVLDAEEVKKSRPKEYDETDVGVECTLWRLDVAMECRLAGIPYMPVKAVGYWRKNAQQRNIKGGGREWKPDNLPNTWTSEMVAEKRAEVNAIKKAFDLAFEVSDPAHGVIDGDGMIVIQRQLEALERSETPVQRPTPVYEADGDILFDNPVQVYAASAPPELDLPDEVVQTIHDEVDFGELGPMEPEPEPPSVAAAGSTPDDRSTQCPQCHAPTGKPHAKNCPTLKAGSTPAQAPADDMDPYIMLFHDPDIEFPAATVKVITQIRGLAGGDTMSPEQHGYIVGMLDKTYGDGDFKPHKMILCALAGRLVDKDHPLAVAQKAIVTWFKHPDINKEEIAGMDWLAGLVIDRFRDEEDV